MFEVCVQQMRDAFLPGAPDTRAGNTDPRMFHQGVYAADGLDRWVAVTFESAAQWQAFEEAEKLAASDAASRNTALAQWCGQRRDVDAVDALQRLGVAAGVVQDMSDLMERDPQIQARRPLVPLHHPLLGEFGHMATPIAFSRCVAAPFRAPAMGEHNRTIAGQICGLSASRIDELEQQGVFK